jgi:hypothetical protein
LPEVGGGTGARATGRVIVDSVLVASIIIPTFRRPDSLTRTLRSLKAQEGAPEAEILVIDNCPNHSAREATLAEAKGSPIPILYDHEPVAGVAAARNRGVALAKAPLIVFIDDDQEAVPRWLALLVESQRAYDADAVFGRQIATFEGGPPPEADLYGGPFERSFSEPSGILPRRHYAMLGTGCSLFHTRALGTAPFDPALGLAGGEDSALFKRLAREKRVIVWCREAAVKDYVPSNRANFKFVMERRFSSGQVRTSTCVGVAPAQPLEAIKWMAVGAVQVGLYGTLAAAAGLVRPPLARHFLAKASGGLGKVLWMSPFRLLRYPTQKQREKSGASS